MTMETILMVMAAKQIVQFQAHLDIVVMVSGDGDFVPLVQKIRNTYNVRCEIYGFEHNTAIDLKEVADDFHPIGKNLILDNLTEDNRI